MSVKGMIRKATIACILAATMFWTAIMAGNAISTQEEAMTAEQQEAPAIMPERSETKQRRVMDVDEMCTLLNIKRLEREDHVCFPTTTAIDRIRISMGEICEKEKSFEDKAAPITEIVNGRELKVIYSQLIIKDITDQDKSTVLVLENKHLQALNTFLQMFSGCRIEKLFIENKKITHNIQEQQKIIETLRTASMFESPIIVEHVSFYSSIDGEVKTTHPVLLRVVLNAMIYPKASNEKIRCVEISTADNHVQETLRLLGTLKCRKVKNIKIWIEAKEHTEGPLATIGSNQEEAVQECVYKIDKLEISSENGNGGAIIPAWFTSISRRTEITRMSTNMINSKIFVTYSPYSSCSFGGM